MKQEGTDAMTAMTTTLRNRLFLRGIILGGALGVLVGSVMAFQIGNNRVDTIKGTMIRWARRNKSPIDYSKMYV
jgi:hypothetical protein